MFNLCHTKRDKCPGALAIAHSQINEKDPLRFFVTRDMQIIVNPVIVNHTKHFVDSEEGCLSYPKKDQIIVQRWNKCEVEYNIVLDDESKDKTKDKVAVKLSERLKENFGSKTAKVFQHEIDHMNSIFIYDEEPILVEDCLKM